MNVISLLIPKIEVAYIKDTCTIRQGLEKMRAHGYTAIPVINPNGEYVGMVSEGDFLYAVCEYSKGGNVKQLEKIKLSEIMRDKRDKAATVNAKMDELLLLIMQQNFVPVVDDRNTFIGIVTRRDIIKYYYDKEKKENE